MSQANEPSHITEAKRAAARTILWTLCVILLLTYGGLIAIIIVDYAHNRKVGSTLWVIVLVGLPVGIVQLPKIWRRGHPKAGR